jgi:CRP-like cAMP-binding protein
MLRKLPDDITALATTPLFRDLSKRELDAARRLGTVVDLGARRRVRCPEQQPAQFAVVVWGKIAATTTDGRRRVLGAGDWFGTVADGPDAYAERAAFETLTDTTLFVMNRREFLRCRALCPRLAARVSGLFDETREIHMTTGALASSAAR